VSELVTANGISFAKNAVHSVMVAGVLSFTSFYFDQTVVSYAVNLVIE